MLHVSKQAVQEIIEEFNGILNFSKFPTSALLKKVFRKHNLEFEKDVVEEITFYFYVRKGYNIN